MRVFTLLCTTLAVACLNPTISYGQGTEQHRPDEQSEPYHKHHDTRHGHDHFYPDRGAIVRDLPRGTIGTSYAGVSYRYHDAIWLEPRGPAFMVIAPPVGLVAPTLPLYSTVVTHGGETFLYANDTYYRPRPDLSGYEVVNDPFEESAPAAPPEALVGGQLPGAPAATQPAALTGGAISAAVVPSAAVLPLAGSGATAAPATAQAETGRVATQAASFPPPAGSITSASAPATNLASGTATSGMAASAATPYAPSTAGATAVPIPVPAGSTAGSVATGTPKGPKVFLYPKNGQTSDQQARDRYDCYRFAVTQSGFDPMRSTGATGELQSDYERAQSACFEARGYASR